VAATLTDVRKQSDGAWRFTWTGTGPYDVVMHGQYLAQGQTAAEYTYSDFVRLGETSDYADTAPPVEVIDTADTTTCQSLDHPPYARLQWRGNAAWTNYRVEQYISAVWTEVDNIAEAGTGYYLWHSDPLTDGATHQFRVIAVDQRGYESDPLAYSALVVTSPTPADVTLSYSAGTGLVTVAAA
jgi:hypothetical protein